MLERIFTATPVYSENRVSFKQAASLDEGCEDSLSVPEEWSLEAADVFSDALYAWVPQALSSVEENTVPSWLWRRNARPGSFVRKETGALEVFSRVVGAATYKGWKAGLWRDEESASVFFDEAMAVLLSRKLVFAPGALACLGVDWAYGAASAEPVSGNAESQTNVLVIQNDTIDAILRKNEPSARNKWSRFCESSRTAARARVVFADTMAEWNSVPYESCAPRAQINLMLFRKEDGNLDLVALEQTAILAVVLMSLYEDVLKTADDPAWPLELGITNLSALLMSLALAYDSAQGRATAASLTAIIGGSAVQASAFLAERQGVCPAFAARKEAVLRTLRNRLRASFGEETDYEKLSIAPRTISLESGADLVVISAARRACEKALRETQKHGLRHMHVTTFFHDSALIAFSESSAQGVEAEGALVRESAQTDGTFARTMHPAVALGMRQLGHDASSVRAVRERLVGARTLVGAPGISQTALREKGFDDATLSRVEASLQRISHLRQAFTPWALGVDFCKETLGIPEALLKDFRCDVLRHLGFSSREISVASAFCCGTASARGSLDLNEGEHAVFVTREELAPEAHIAMAAAVQPFVDGDVCLSLAVPESVVGEVRSSMLLMAWRAGLRNVTLFREGPSLVQGEKRTVHAYIAQRSAAHRTRKSVPSAQKKQSLRNKGSAGAIDPSRAVAPLESKRKPSVKEKA